LWETERKFTEEEQEEELLKISCKIKWSTYVPLPSAEISHEMMMMMLILFWNLPTYVPLPSTEISQEMMMMMMMMLSLFCDTGQGRYLHLAKP